MSELAGIYLRFLGLDHLPANPGPAPSGAGHVSAGGTLDELREQIGDCQRCRLASGRTNIVFGVGDPGADLMFVGEAPGRDEDLQGEPFVGKAGQMLTDIIEKGMGLNRSDVYICNVLKCRPPENRDPLPDEVAACRQFLARQIQIVSPKVICALGSFAARELLGQEARITRVRGTFRESMGIPVMPTYHPSYLLRNQSAKREVWEDIKKIMARMGLAPPARK